MYQNIYTLSIDYNPSAQMLVFSLIVCITLCIYIPHVISFHQQIFQIQNKKLKRLTTNKLLMTNELIPQSFLQNYKTNIAIGTTALYGLFFVNTLKDKYMASASGFPIYGSDTLMNKKAHGTSEYPVQSKLRWNCDVKVADRICNYNRNFAEYAGYWSSSDVTFLKEINEETIAKEGPIKFYDSVTGKLLFNAPIGRSFAEWKDESLVHGWPSFRDSEVVWDNVCALKGGETISLTGTHLGHNLPDRKGNRYCINLVSIAGYPNNTNDDNRPVITSILNTKNKKCSCMDSNNCNCV